MDLRLAELTGDAYSDCMVRIRDEGAGPDAAWVMANDGAGHFEFREAVPVTNWGWGCIGDFNGDSRNDLMLSNSPPKVWYATSDYHFTDPPVQVPNTSGVTPWTILSVSESADLDADGCDDLIATSHVAQIRVYWGSTSGLQSNPLAINWSLINGCDPSGFPPEIGSITPMDIDGNGTVDLGISARYGDGDQCGSNTRAIGWIKNLGNRHLASAISWIWVEQPVQTIYYSGVSFRRINVDQTADVLFSPSGFNEVRYLESNGSGGWTYKGVVIPAGGAPITADYDRDGLVDCLVTRQAFSPVCKGGAGGAFAVVDSVIGSGAYTEFGLGELDGVPGMDLVGSSWTYQSLVVLHNVVAPVAAVASGSARLSPVVIRPTVIGDSGARISLSGLGVDPQSKLGARARITISDVVGRTVRTLDAPSDPSEETWWDARDARGEPLPSGRYWISLEGNSARAGVIVVR